VYCNVLYYVCIIYLFITLHTLLVCDWRTVVHTHLRCTLWPWLVIVHTLVIGHTAGTVIIVPSACVVTIVLLHGTVFIVVGIIWCDSWRIILQFWHTHTHAHFGCVVFIIDSSRTFCVVQLLIYLWLWWPVHCIRTFIDIPDSDWSVYWKFPAYWSLLPVYFVLMCICVLVLHYCVANKPFYVLCICSLLWPSLLL